MKVSHCTAFDPNGEAETLWEDLMKDGALDSSSRKCVTSPQKKKKEKKERLNSEGLIFSVLADAVCI